MAIIAMVSVAAFLGLPSHNTAVGARATPIASPQAPDPAQLYTGIDKVTPAEPKVGQPATITALIFNTGDAAGKKDIVFKLDGAVKETKKDVSLDPKKSTSISFTFTPSKEGTYTVDVDGQIVRVTVVAASAPTPASPTTPATPPAPSPTPTPAATVKTGQFAITPTQVNAGEKVTISATVTNGGDTLAKKTIALKINDKPVETREISLDARRAPLSRSQPPRHNLAATT